MSLYFKCLTWGLDLIEHRQATQAGEKELLREDDILLQATSFSQSALWIYLSLVPSSIFLDLMKWAVPSTAIAFYGVRAYAKLKESNVWRLRSVYLLTGIIINSILSVFIIGAGFLSNWNQPNSVVNFISVWF